MTRLGPFSVDFITTSDMLTLSPLPQILSSDIGHTGQDHQLLSMDQIVPTVFPNDTQQCTHDQVGCSAHDQFARWTPFNLDPVRCSRECLVGPGLIGLKGYSSENLLSRKIGHREKQVHHSPRNNFSKLFHRDNLDPRYPRRLRRRWRCSLRSFSRLFDRGLAWSQRPILIIP